MPDPYRPDEDPAFYPDETAPRRRRRDQGRHDADRPSADRSTLGRRETGRRAVEPPERARRGPDTRDRAVGDPAVRDPAPRDRALRGPDTRERPRRDAAPHDPAAHDLISREPGPHAADPGLPDPGYRPDPRARDWGQIKPGQIEPRQRGPRRSGTGRGQSEPGPVRTSRRRPSGATGPSWRWGELSGGRGTLIILAAAVIGTGVTVTMHHNPGYLLGGAVIIGTLAATLAVRRVSVYQLIPVPALIYLAGAVAAGLLHVQDSGPTRSGLAVSATQWVAGGFVTMIAATAVAIAVTVIRWLMHRRAGSSERFPEPEPLASGRPSSRTVFPTGPETDSWRARPQPAAAPRPEPPSWPWPEEPVPRSKRAGRREPAPTDPFSRPRSPARADPASRPRSPSRADPASRPRSPSPAEPPPRADPASRPRSPSRAEPPRRANPAPQLDPPSRSAPAPWANPGPRPGPPSFGTPRD